MASSAISMDRFYKIDDSMNITASEFSLGRSRSRKWVPLITQQLRLRHVYQITAYNLPIIDKKALFYFTLHTTGMSSPFYTSEKLNLKNPKWKELVLLNNDPSINSSATNVVIRIWKSTPKINDEIITTWGVNFTGLVCLGNKITDLHPKFFKSNTVIFFMQGVYFTSQNCIRNDDYLDKSVPFQRNLNLIQRSSSDADAEEQTLYKNFAIRVAKVEITGSYSLEQLRKMQHLQRELIRRKINLDDIKKRIITTTEKDTKEQEENNSSSTLNNSDNNNIRYASPLLTMSSLNKMLHKKPTKAERELMDKISKKIEDCKFRLRILYQERDKKSANLRRLKLIETKLTEENEEKNSELMNKYHLLSKESRQWDEYKIEISMKKNHLNVINERLLFRQTELLRQLLFIYPIDKLPNENKYTMLGIHLPDSELLLDYQDPGVSVVLGYACHIIFMCSIFLQVPLRHPVKHFGSRSVIFDQVYPDIPDKEREFPLYTKGRDRAHFSYAVFLLNKNISQLRWYLHHRTTLDLKETLKHLRNLLLGEEINEKRRLVNTLDQSTNNRLLAQDGNKILSLDVSVASSCDFNDSLLVSEKIFSDRLQEDLEREKHSVIVKTPKKITMLKSSKILKRENSKLKFNEIFAIPEAYLNGQISKDIFHQCALSTELHRKNPKTEEKSIIIRQGVEEEASSVQISNALTTEHSDSIEEGTDPLDPATNFDLMITKPIDINNTAAAGLKKTQISHSLVAESENITKKLISNTLLSSSCDNKAPEMENQLMLQQLMQGESSLVSPKNELYFPADFNFSLQENSSNPLSERTDRLLSSNQSFNLVKHRYFSN